MTDLENVGHLAEDHHRCFDASVQLAHPANAAGDRRDVTQDLRVVFVLLVDGRDCLDLRLERLEDLLVLDAQVDVEARHRVKLRQQLQRLRNLHHPTDCRLRPVNP